ncbi:hypothetical protein BH23ACT10_BH23ACT10_26790 [soil metagenome]
MAAALDALGPRLRSLPDGETGDRRDWIIHTIESFRDHPDLQLRSDGTWSDYDDIPTFKVRSGHELTADRLDLGLTAAFDAAFPTFLRLRDEHGYPDLRFQVGVPGDLDMALFALGPTGPLRHRAPFAAATANEITAIHARGGDDVVFQLELPAELVSVARVPTPAQRAVATYLASGIARLVSATPIGARFGIHLCLGDMNHRALGAMRDAGPLVRLANAIADRWPPTHPLDFVHVPLAAAVEPPPNRTSFYAPLARLTLPTDVALVAGFVHESLHIDAQEQLLRHLTELTGRTVDVASSCGLGRRDRPRAEAAMELAGRLCDRVATNA